MDIILKTDQEPAMKSLLEDIRGRRPKAKTFVEHSPVRESASNGVIERGIQSVQGMLRSLKIALEEKRGMSSPD